MSFQPIKRNQVIAALKEEGPMTRIEIAEYLGWPLIKVGEVLGSTRNLLPGQVFRAVRYVPRTGKGGVPMAVFSADAGPDAPRPIINKRSQRSSTQAVYRDKNRASINAKHRLRRAARDGKMTAVNPWLQLAPASLRAAMSKRPVLRTCA